MHEIQALEKLYWLQTGYEEANSFISPDSKSRLCMYTDASDVFWSAIRTQIRVEAMKSRRNQQGYDPLTIFWNLQRQATEMVNIVKRIMCSFCSTENLHWLLPTPSGFDLFPNH